MNKPSIIAGSVLIAIDLVGNAYADNSLIPDLSSRNWSGFYAGVNTGFVFNHVELRSQQLGFTNPSEHCDANADFSTFFPGIQLGFMYQFPHSLVAGVEANVTFNTNQSHTINCNCPNNPEVADRFSFRNEKQSSIRSRGGRALNWNNGIFLPYLTAGASFTEVGLTYKNEGGDFYSKNTNQAGWLIGAGIEWSFKQNWSLRAEYSYADYGNIIKLKIPSIYDLVDPNGHAYAALNTNTLLIAVSYWL